MTLEDLAYISQIAGVIAVFASLIFVGIQVRQNSEQIKANTRPIKASAGFEATHSWPNFASSRRSTTNTRMAPSTRSCSMRS